MGKKDRLEFGDKKKVRFCICVDLQLMRDLRKKYLHGEVGNLVREYLVELNEKIYDVPF